MSNNPPVIVELSPELATFLEDQISNTIAVGLMSLNVVSKREVAEVLVDQLEKYKEIRKAVQRGQEERKPTTVEDPESPQG